MKIRKNQDFASPKIQLCQNTRWILSGWGPNQKGMRQPCIDTHILCPWKNYKLTSALWGRANPERQHLGSQPIIRDLYLPIHGYQKSKNAFPREKHSQLLFFSLICLPWSKIGSYQEDNKEDMTNIWRGSKSTLPWQYNIRSSHQGWLGLSKMIIMS